MNLKDSVVLSNTIEISKIGGIFSTPSLRDTPQEGKNTTRCYLKVYNTVETIHELALQMQINDIFNQVSIPKNSPLEGCVSVARAGWRKKLG